MKLRRRAIDMSHRYLRFGIVGIGVGLLFVGMIQLLAMPGSVRNALEDSAATPINISPNPYGFLLYKSNGNWWPGSWFDGLTNGQSSNTGFKHLLKNEQSSHVNKITVIAYYPTRAAAEAARFQVHRERCGFSAPDSGPDRLKLTINPNADIDSGTPGVQAPAPVFDEKATDSASDATCAAFGGRYSVPANSVSTTPDPGTGYYKVILSFQLTGPRRANLSSFQQVRFQVKALNGGGIFGLEKNTTKTEFGIAENFGDGDYSIAAGIPFGRSCSEDPAPISGAVVRVYDADTVIFGEIGVAILQRDDGATAWQPLGPTDYDQRVMENTSPGTSFSWNAASQRWDITTSGSDTTSNFIMRSFQRDKDYMLIIDNKHQPPLRSPTGNVLSVSVPGDTINAGFSCDYQLTPGVEQAPAAGTFFGDADFDVTGKVNKNEDADNDDHEWQLTMIRSSSKPTNHPLTYNTQDPCSWMSNCSILEQGTQNGGFNSATFSRSHRYTENNVAVGTWICFMMSVRKPTAGSSANTWAHSGLICNVAALQPRVEIWGHDLRVVGGTDTSLTNVIRSGGSPEIFGSWGEYGVFSGELNNHTSSGLGLNGGVGSTQQSTWSNLTFGNVDSLGLDAFGSYANSYDMYQQPDAANVVNRPDGYHFGGQNFGAGTDTLYIVDGTAYIDENLEYVGSYNRASNIPRVTIIAKDIIIQGDVTRIDPSLVALDDAGTATQEGRISTCSSISGFQSFATSRLLSSRICDRPLKFNSAVYVNKLYLYRTAGNNYPDAAETFNLRGDVFMSAVGAGANDSVATTDVITELPPRF